MKRSLLVLVALVCACAYNESVRLTDPLPPRAKDAPVAVVVSPDAPIGLLKAVEPGDVSKTPPPGRLIARLTVRRNNLEAWSASINAAKEQARNLGGDGIHVRSGEPFGTLGNPRSTLEVDVYRRAP